MSRDAVLWAFRMFIGRDPADEAELAFHQRNADLDTLRRCFAETREFIEFQRRSKPEDYRAPLFLLQPPADPLVPWRFQPPELAAPVSQLCTQGQFDEPIFAELCAMLDIIPNPHRKVWEFCYVVAVMRAAGLMRPGIRALGFGVGQEPIPALLARSGVAVVATDAPDTVVHLQGWASTGQHAAGLEALDRPAILPFAELQALVEFRPVDMNAIPETLRGFDVCWSSCAFEHLGSIALGLRFFEESLETLKPGGIAVHTTEFNLSSDTETFDTAGLCLFRKRDMEAMLGRLAAAGHKVWPLNLHPGSAAVDAHIDLPPYALPHLKLALGQYVTTSIGLVVQKAG
ncbi:MAG: class I SAM-dependent methyltransferase [Acetobacteraceae bacterium]|nr:MAG: class I SAM-dependent methyltransferase [Acetobacteraceae bacterium]